MMTRTRRERFLGLSAVAASLVVAGVAAVATPAMAADYTYQISDTSGNVKNGSSTNLNLGLTPSTGAIASAWNPTSDTILTITLTGNQEATTILGTGTRVGGFLFNGNPITPGNLAGLDTLTINGGGHKLTNAAGINTRVLDIVLYDIEPVETLTINNLTVTGARYSTNTATTVATGGNSITTPFGVVGSIKFNNTNFTSNSVQTNNSGSNALGGGLFVTSVNAFDYKGGEVRGNSAFASSMGQAEASGGGLHITGTGVGDSDSDTEKIILSGLTISQNEAKSVSTNTSSNRSAFGGGVTIVHIRAATAVSISGTTFTGNTAEASNLFRTNNTSLAAALGGGLYVNDGNNGNADSLTITNTSFIGNKAISESNVGAAASYARGGAIWTNISTTISSTTTFTNNEVNNTNGSVAGGAIFMQGQDVSAVGVNQNLLILDKVTFDGNKATGTTGASGGAIYVLGDSAAKNGDITFTNVKILNSEANAVAATGGGVGVALVDMFSFTGGEVKGNKATGNDANSTLIGNVSGGGLHLLRIADKIVIDKVDFVGNSVTNSHATGNAGGGALAIDNFGLGTPANSITLTDVSFTGNSVTANGTAIGGAIFSNADFTIKAATKDVLFSGNTTTSGTITVANDIHLDLATMTLNAASGKRITLDGGVTGSGNVIISGLGKTVVTADTDKDLAPFQNTGTLTFAADDGTDGVLSVRTKAAQLGNVTTDTAMEFYFMNDTGGVTATKANIDYSSISGLFFTTTYDDNANFISITRKTGSVIPLVSSSVADAIASYDPSTSERNAILDDVIANSTGDALTDAQRIEMGYNAASGVGAAQLGVAALSGVYGVMDGVFSGKFAHGGGGVYRGQECDPCSPCGTRSRLERAVWVMPIYGHQDATGLHSGNINYGYTSDQYAAVFGAEVKSGKTRLGIAGNAGIGRAVSHLAAGPVHTNSDLTYGGVSLYAVRNFGKIESNAQVGWIGTKNELRQRNGAVNAAADIDGGLVYAALGFERPYHVGNLTLAPIFGLEFTHLYQKAFATNVNGNAIFNAQSGNANMLHLPLGLKASANYKTRFGQWSPMVKARVLPSVGDHELAFSNLATGSTTAATLRGIVSDTVAGDVTFGSSLKRGHNELGAGYTVLFSEHFKNQNVSVMVKRTF